MDTNYTLINYTLCSETSMKNLGKEFLLDISYIIISKYLSKTINKYESRLSNSINIEDIIASIDNELYNEYLQINNKNKGIFQKKIREPSAH